MRTAGDVEPSENRSSQDDQAILIHGKPEGGDVAGHRWPSSSGR